MREMGSDASSECPVLNQGSESRFFKFVKKGNRVNEAGPLLLPLANFSAPLMGMANILRLVMERNRPRSQATSINQRGPTISKPTNPRSDLP